jgi:hypothetical protein
MLYEISYFSILFINKLASVLMRAKCPANPTPFDLIILTIASKH